MQFKYPNKFIQALTFTLKWEGGYSNHPMDKGGPTNKGITQHTFDEYCKDIGIPNRPVKSITDDEVKDIYYTYYYLPSKSDNLYNKLAVVVFDTAVHSGVKRARLLLNKTQDPNEYIYYREEFLRDISKGSNKVFLKGWINRLNDLRAYIIKI